MTRHYTFKKRIILFILMTIPAILAINENQINSAKKAIAQPEIYSPKNRYGGTLYWGTSNKPSIINPVVTSSTESISIMDLVFNRLIRLTAKGEIEPDLALRWDISDDGRIYTFYLRDDVKFHDGAALTAEDVLFTFAQIMEPKNKSPYRISFEVVNKMEVVDPHTFRITLSKPCTPFLCRLTAREIIPKHILDGKDILNAEFNYNPIGTGPFRFQHWDKETGQIILTANEDYFEGRPYLDRIIIRTYPNISDLWEALMKGDVDFVKFISFEDHEILKKDPTFKVYSVDLNMYWGMVYDLQDPILKNKDIRLAIAHTINRAELAQKAFGAGIESLGPFYPESLGFNPAIKPIDHDPLKAKNILARIGWRDIDKDGILEKGKQRFILRMLIDERNEIYQKLAKMIRQQLAGVGIKLEIILYNSPDQLTKEFIAKNKAQIWLRLFSGMGNDPHEVAEQWGSSQTCFYNLWCYKNRKNDKLIQTALAQKNGEIRNETYQKLYKNIYEDQPACFLFYPSTFHAINNKLKNTHGFFVRHMPTHTIRNWYIDLN